MIPRLRTFGGLSIESARPLTGAATQRRPLAFLALLAAAGSRGMTRDRAIALLWPESDAEHGQNSLSQVLSALRREVADQVVTATPILRLNPDVIASDVADFHERLDSKDLEGAAALYAGPFLDGFFIRNAPEFEHWVDQERLRLHHLQAHALEQLASAARERADTAAAVRWCRQRASLTPTDSSAARALMEALVAAGDSAGAVEHYRIHQALIRSELEFEPDPALAAFALALRVEPRATSTHSNASGVVGEREGVDTDVPSVAMGAPSPEPPPKPRPRTFLLRTLGIAVGLTAVVVGAAVIRRDVRAATRAQLAVGPIRVQSTDTLLSPGLVRQILAMDLARIEGIDVVSAERITELLAPFGSKADTGPVVIDAARKAGATQALQGILSIDPTGTLRIDVERVDLRSGIILSEHSEQGSDIFSLADRISESVAGDLGHSFAQKPLGQVTSTSLVARRLYDEGLRFYYVGELPAAFRLFESALREDSTFAMAAYFGSQTTPDSPTQLQHLALALRLSKGAPERERLLIETEWAISNSSLAALPLARTLASRFPLEPDAEVEFGTVLMWTGEWPAAVIHLRRAIDASFDTSRVPASHVCRSCAGFTGLFNVYVMSDSLGAAERVAREWIARQPKYAGGLALLADVYEKAGRTEDARAAFAEASRLIGRDLVDANTRVRFAFHDGDFATADRLLEDQIMSGDPVVRSNARLQLAISLLEQGRTRAALRFTEREKTDTQPSTDRGSLPTVYAQALFESGRFHESAVMSDSLASETPPFFVDALKTATTAEAGTLMASKPTMVAGHWTRWLTRSATAWAAAGDTGRLVRLADSVEQFGAHQVFGDERRRHFYIRGLLLEARHDYVGAEAAFRQAMYSPTVGDTRINLELARVELALGHAANAIATLQSALRVHVGWEDSFTPSVTRTELHDALAQAFASAGQIDSARAHYAWVARAWSGGDPPFRARAESAATKAGLALPPVGAAPEALHH